MDRPAAWRAIAIDLEAERPFRVGGASVDPVSRDARYNGRSERLQPQTLKVLIALVRRRGEVVTRSELIASCWGGRIVGEDVINRSISLLRDFAERVGGFSIETVPKAGYRLNSRAGAPGAALWLLRATRNRNTIRIVLTAALVIGGVSWKVQTSSAEPVRIAILPFEASGVDPAFAEGVSDELLARLTRSDRVRVTGRTSSEQFRGAPHDLRSIGRKLDVEYIVEGTVRYSGQQLQVAVSLVDARDGSAAWAQTFKGNRDAIPAIEAAVGSAIGQRLQIGLDSSTNSKTDGQAFELYVQAKGLMRDRNSEGLTKAIELLRQALRLDPTFAPAWAQIAAALHLALAKDVAIDLGNGTTARMSKRDAAERAVRLDPNLAEAHAILGLLSRGTTQAKVHLRRAIELAPSDTQALYWWGAALAEAGDYRRAGEVMRRTADLDPLWKRPVQEAVASSLVRGDRAGALRYLRTIKNGSPAAAVEVEAHMAFADADFSRVVELELADRGAPWDAGKATAVRTLLGLGFNREALLVGPFGPFAKAVFQGHAPPLPMILQHLQNDADEGDDLPIYAAVTYELAKERRWHDLAAIYDAKIGLMSDVNGTDPSGRYYRQKFAAVYSLALNRVGRKREAVELAWTAAEGAKRTLANGEVPCDVLVSIAGTEAILGRHDGALKHLEQAFTGKWRLDEFVIPRLSGRPEFGALRSNPQFKRLQGIQNAHIERERREVLALGIF